MHAPHLFGTVLETDNWRKKNGACSVNLQHHYFNLQVCSLKSLNTKITSYASGARELQVVGGVHTIKSQN